jgi:hypothetical protein
MNGRWGCCYMKGGGGGRKRGEEELICTALWLMSAAVSALAVLTVT